MPKRGLDGVDDDGTGKRHWTADTWNAGFLHDHKKSLEKRHAASRQLCDSNHEITLQSILRFLRLLAFLHILVSHNFTAEDVVSVTFNNLEGVLPVSKRRMLLQSVAQSISFIGSPASSPRPFLIKLPRESSLFNNISDYMRGTIRQHRNNHSGDFSDYNILQIEMVRNEKLWERYIYRRNVVRSENGNVANEHLLYHGSPNVKEIIQSGFDERHSNIKAMFGGGVYLTDVSSKANLYVYGEGGGNGCEQHKDTACLLCDRQMLLCRTTLGAAFTRTDAKTYSSPPPGHHSVVGLPSKHGLWHPEFAIYRGEQLYPLFLITYKLLL